METHRGSKPRLNRTNQPYVSFRNPKEEEIKDKPAEEEEEGKFQSPLSHHFDLIIFYLQIPLTCSQIGINQLKSLMIWD